VSTSKPKPYERGIGRFHLGDIVEWRGSKHKHKGEIVQVVKYGMYPMVCRNEHEILKTRKLRKEDIDWPELHTGAYYREHESYVVEDRLGKRWWPRVRCLRLVQEMNADG
jgi:hypothetical protein